MIPESARLIPNTVPNVYAVDPNTGLCYPVAAWGGHDLSAYAVGPVGLFEADNYAIRVIPGGADENDLNSREIDL